MSYNVQMSYLIGRLVYKDSCYFFFRFSYLQLYSDISDIMSFKTTCCKHFDSDGLNI